MSARLGLTHLYENHIQDYDWLHNLLFRRISEQGVRRFLVAEDSNYVAVNNLRVFLAQYSPNDYHYFGPLLWKSCIG